MLGHKSAADLPINRLGEFSHLPAGLANEMMMVPWALRVEALFARGPFEAPGFDQPLGFQPADCSVDRGEVNVWVGATSLNEQFIGGWMAPAVFQELQNQAPLLRHPAAVLSKARLRLNREIAQVRLLQIICNNNKSRAAAGEVT